jgi:GMP synthase (glutamine-hydrolysing)
MSLIVFEHHPLETAALLGSILLHYGHRLRVVQLHAGEAVPPDLDDVEGVISMGGPMNVDEAADHPWMDAELAYLRQAHETGVPIVGVCLGAQLIAKALGGTVEPMQAPEVGWHVLKLAFPGTIDPVFAGIPWQHIQFHLHGQHVAQLPPGATPLAGSQATRNQAFKVGLKTYGFQYHFEWDERILGIVSRDPLVEKAGLTADEIMQSTGEHYDGYRRLSNRLCHNIAGLLFPIDRR